MFEVPPSIHSGGFGSYQNTWEVFLAWSKDFGVFNIEEMDVIAVMKSSVCYCPDALRQNRAGRGKSRAAVPTDNRSTQDRRSADSCA